MLQKLSDFLKNPCITFFEVGIQDDATKLKKEHNTLMVANAVELAPLAAKIYFNEKLKSKKYKKLESASLKILVKLILELEFEKPDDVRMSEE
ncbi:hypothetical protein RHMOL_Rhmol09G0148300 [Rhododendron molle]|uniref:Uncharacterized protein n=1 Tax=Rhododendron molle TaxID=49168 RepID=A0ACC0MDJ4_RHOML|nr:hypothetical protein RHMOL_Rhmol09G0148300 [Rhododendron molle]